MVTKESFQIFNNKFSHEFAFVSLIWYILPEDFGMHDSLYDAFGEIEARVDMVAKVITPQGMSFFVKKGEDIHNPPPYDGLPLQDKKYLACESVKGCYDGFALISTFHDNIFVTRDRQLPLPPLPGVGAKWEIQDTIPILVLPAGTRIEPRTNQQMEDELRARRHPPLREK